MKKLFIPVVESQKHINKQKGVETQELPIQKLGTTYVMAQTSCWLDEDNFIVGRWDGSLSIFDKTTSVYNGAKITVANSVPADEGVQMVAYVSANKFISSNDKDSMVVWTSTDPDWQDVSITQTLQYEASFGIANCACILEIDGNLLLISGHESGYILIWKGTLEGENFELFSSVDLTSENPTNPWNLQNIRAIQTYGDQYVVTGSENGLICVVEIPSGDIISQIVYNPDAERGINSISLFEESLIVGNCSVGTADKNFWLYTLNTKTMTFEYCDSTNLIIDTSRDQVFNFCVTWGFYNSNLYWYSATEEAALWMGTVTDDLKIQVDYHDIVAVADLGATLAATRTDLSYVAYNVNSFNTNQNDASAVQTNANPNFPS
jgi:WD40 repeat protein